VIFLAESLGDSDYPSTTEDDLEGLAGLIRALRDAHGNERRAP